jgi:hypothetical protein
VESANWNSIGYKKLIAKSTSALSERQRERQRERERESERWGRGRGERETDFLRESGIRFGDDR